MAPKYYLLKVLLISLVEFYRDVTGQEGSVQYFVNSLGIRVLQSPGYPDHAPTQTSFGWHLLADGPGQMELLCTDITLTKRSDCSQGYLDIVDVSTSTKICNVLHSYSKRVDGNYLYVYLKTESSGYGKVSCSVRLLPIDNNTQNVYLQLPGEPDSAEQGIADQTSLTSCQCSAMNKRRVIGGQETKENEFTFMAYLRDKGKYEGFCGGSILTKRHVLTAAHCVRSRLDMNFQVIVGLHDIAKGSKNNAMQAIDVQKIHAHNDVYKDIAIVELKKDIKFDDFVGAVCLPTEHYDMRGQWVKALGWGFLTTEGPHSPTLQKVNLKVLDLQECAKYYYGVSPDLELLCTFAEGRDVCQGDSGGPLLFFDQDLNRFVQVGLLTVAPDPRPPGGPCVVGIPTVHTFVFTHYDWIQDIIFRRGMGSIPHFSLLKGRAVRLGTSSGDHQEQLPRLHRLFSQVANKKGDLPAIIVPDENVDGKGVEMSYSEVESASNRLSQALTRLAKPTPNPDGDRVVVVCLTPSADLILTLLAVWKCGSVYLPLQSGAPQDRVRHILAEAKPFLVITSQDELPLFSQLVRTVTVEELMSSAASSQPPPSPSSSHPDPVQIILYTSGSTGLSKGVRIRLSSILNRLHWGWREFPYSRQEEVCVFKTALTFVDSVPELWGPLLAGRPVLVLSKSLTQDPQRLLPLLHKYKIGRLVLVPTLLKALLTYLDFSQEKPDILKHLKLWICSGETLSVTLASEFFKKFEAEGDKLLCNFYGSTEVMGDVTAHVMRSLSDVAVSGKVPIGSPVDNTITYLLDKKLDMVQVGEIGELYVGGRHICAGYVNGRDSFRFVPSPHTVDPDYKCLYRTGDYGRVEQGTLLYEGRTDCQIKVRGHRVDLSEVEAALCKLEAVQKGVVLCYHPAQTDQEIVGFVLLQNKLNSSSEIQENLKQSLPGYAIPLIVIVESIPLLENGKIDRQYLLKYFEEQVGDDFSSSDLVGIEAGREEAARCLFQTVYSTLGPASRGKISPTANFYQIGGNSLNSVLTIAKLKGAGYDIKISDFISAPDLATVAQRMTLGPSENGSQTEEKYTVEFIDEKYKENIYSIIGESFGCFQRPEVGRTMEPPVKRSEYDALMDGLWPTLIRQKLSIVLKNEEEAVVGCSLFMDISDEPQLHLTGQLSYVFQFLEYLELPIIENMLPQGRILHSFMLGTGHRLSPQENIEVTLVMERAIEEIGRSKGFIGIFSTNTSPLTQQLAENILNYKQLKSYQINEFVASDGTRPFRRGADSLLAVSAYKQLSTE